MILFSNNSSKRRQCIQTKVTAKIWQRGMTRSWKSQDLGLAERTLSVTSNIARGREHKKELRVFRGEELALLSYWWHIEKVKMATARWRFSLFCRRLFYLFKRWIASWNLENTEDIISSVNDFESTEYFECTFWHSLYETMIDVKCQKCC